VALDQIQLGFCHPLRHHGRQEPLPVARPVRNEMAYRQFSILRTLDLWKLERLGSFGFETNEVMSKASPFHRSNNQGVPIGRPAPQKPTNLEALAGLLIVHS